MKISKFSLIAIILIVTGSILTIFSGYIFLFRLGEIDESLHEQELEIENFNYNHNLYLVSDLSALNVDSQIKLLLEINNKSKSIESLNNTRREIKLGSLIALHATLTLNPPSNETLERWKNMNYSELEKEKVKLAREYGSNLLEKISKSIQLLEQDKEKAINLGFILQVIALILTQIAAMIKLFENKS